LRHLNSLAVNKGLGDERRVRSDGPIGMSLMNAGPLEKLANEIPGPPAAPDRSALPKPKALPPTALLLASPVLPSP